MLKRLAEANLAAVPRGAPRRRGICSRPAVTHNSGAGVGRGGQRRSLTVMLRDTERKQEATRAAAAPARQLLCDFYRAESFERGRRNEPISHEIDFSDKQGADESFRGPIPPFRLLCLNFLITFEPQYIFNNWISHMCRQSLSLPNFGFRSVYQPFPQGRKMTRPYKAEELNSILNKLSLVHEGKTKENATFSRLLINRTGATSAVP